MDSDSLLAFAGIVLPAILSWLIRIRGGKDFSLPQKPANPPSNGNGNGSGYSNGNGQYAQLKSDVQRLDAADKLHDERDSRYHDLRDDLKFFKQDYLLWKEQNAARDRQIDERFGTMQRMLNDLADETRPQD